MEGSTGWAGSGLDGCVPETLYVSVLTLAEIRRGIALLPAGSRRSELEQWMEIDLTHSFLDANILPVTNPIAHRWALLSARAQEQGVQVPVMDGLIAATALEHGLILVTRNVRHFAGLSVA